jgi:hypothetical protein
MPAKKRSKFDRQRDNELVARWYTFGYSIQKVTNKLNEHNESLANPYTLSFQQVAKDIIILRKMLVNRTDKMMDHYVATEMEKLRHLEFEVMEQWEKSKEDLTRKKYKNTTDDKIDETKITEIEIQTKLADTKYIDLLLKIGERKDKLLGIETNINLNANVNVSKGQIVYKPVD